MTNRVLLTETMLVHSRSSTLTESVGGPRYLKESRNGRLIVKLPVTTLDKVNENGRKYSRMVMEGACRNAKRAMEARELLSTVDGHPNDAYVEPGNASHVVTAAWCENDGYMWNEWEVLETHHGRNLRALIEADVSFGVSIRGLGSQDAAGNILEDYEFLGTDGVGNPSAKIRTRAEVQKRPETDLRAESVASPASSHNSLEKSVMTKAEFTRTFGSKLQTVRESVSKTDGVTLVRHLMGLEESLNTDGAKAGLTTTESFELARQLEQVKTAVQSKLSGKDTRAALETSLRENTNLQARVKQLEAGLKTAIQRLEAATGTINTLNSRVAYMVRGKRKLGEAHAATVAGLKEQLKKAGQMVDLAISEAAQIEARYRVALNRLAESETARKVGISEAAVLVKQAVKSALKGKVQESVVTDAPKPTLESRVIALGDTRLNENAADVPHHLQTKLTESNLSGEVKVPGFH